MRWLIARNGVDALAELGAKLFQEPTLRTGRDYGRARDDAMHGVRYIAAAGIRAEVAGRSQEEVRQAVVLVDGRGDDDHLGLRPPLGDLTGQERGGPRKIGGDEAHVGLLAERCLHGPRRVALERAHRETSSLNLLA